MMTVAQLIDELGKYSPDTPVIIGDNFGNFGNSSFPFETVYTVEEKEPDDSEFKLQTIVVNETIAASYILSRKRAMREYLDVYIERKGPNGSNVGYWRKMQNTEYKSQLAIYFPKAR